MPASQGDPAVLALLEEEYERTVRQDIELFREKAAAFLEGKIDEAEFTKFRLRRGIYGQRQKGVQMVRTKIPGGLLDSDQLRQLARVADEFAGGKAHLTTRQNVQFHFVPLARVADLLHLLADKRLTTREACYNTVRNVTCCPLAGLAKDEVFDVRPYARQVAFAFLHKELTDNLPRKFKISFSGCKEDCMLAAIHDVGLRAVVREQNGRVIRGFRVVVGGGLGPLPSEAQVLDEFLPEEELVPRLEAVLRVFNRYGNRENKYKARLKFVLRDRGIDWFRQAVDLEHGRIRSEGGIPVPEAVPEGFGGFHRGEPRLGLGHQLPVINGEPPGQDYARWLQTNVKAQKAEGFSLVTISIPQGNLTSSQMRAIADLADDAADGYIRVTVTQNLALAWAPDARLRQVYAALQRIGLAGAGAGEIDDIVTCPGAYSCNLGLTKTMNLGSALAAVVGEFPEPEVRKLTIKASGCPNACGHHWIGDIGFYGNARKVDGKDMPYYQILLGGGYDRSGQMQFGLAVQAVPARLAPEALRRVLRHYRAHRLPEESFREYVLRFRVQTFKELTQDLAKPAAVEPELFFDWGDDLPFSKELGRGECAA